MCPVLLLHVVLTILLISKPKVGMEGLRKVNILRLSKFTWIEDAKEMNPGGTNGVYIFDYRHWDKE